MEERHITVPAISCEHCTATIERELGEIQGVHVVTADHQSKAVTLRWSLPATWELVYTRLVEIGYPPAE